MRRVLYCGKPYTQRGRHSEVLNRYQTYEQQWIQPYPWKRVIHVPTLKRHVHLESQRKLNVGIRCWVKEYSLKKREGINISVDLKGFLPSLYFTPVRKKKHTSELQIQLHLKLRLRHTHDSQTSLMLTEAPLISSVVVGTLSFIRAQALNQKRQFESRCPIRYPSNITPLTTL